MISTKFSYIGEHIQKLLSPILKDVNFLRYIYYLNPYNSPLEEYYYDENGNKILQPNITKTWKELIEDKTIVLTLFNQTVLKQEKITIFFSYLNARYNDGGAISGDVIYEMNIVVPYSSIMIPNTHEQRQHKIADIVCSYIDNQPIAGVGNVYCISAGSYKENDNYEGIFLRFKVNDFIKGVN